MRGVYNICIYYIERYMHIAYYALFNNFNGRSTIPKTKRGDSNWGSVKLRQI